MPSVDQDLGSNPGNGGGRATTMEREQASRFLRDLLRLMQTKDGSDLFLTADFPPAFKIDGKVLPVSNVPLTPQHTVELARALMNDRQAGEFEAKKELNFAISPQSIGRFRVNAFMQLGRVGVVLRTIQSHIPKFEELDLPPIMKDLSLTKRGLIIMVGATGSGKSTSLAAMLDYRNELKSGHILTLEDPIEFIFRNRKSIVNQREVGTDTLDFKIALKNALRQAPDCILIGEIRDKETMAAAIAYAQSGHLCLATLHANNSYHALNRIISFYPLENRPALLQDLSAALKCIISQRLIRNRVGGRSAAVEVMLNTRHIAELIEKGDISEMKDAMDKSMSPGSQTFEQSFFRMIRDGTITQEEGMQNADSPSNLIWLLNNTEPGATTPGGAAPSTAAPSIGMQAEKQKSAPEPQEASGASFTEITLITEDIK